MNLRYLAFISWLVFVLLVCFTLWNIDRVHPLQAAGSFLLAGSQLMRGVALRQQHGRGEHVVRPSLTVEATSMLGLVGIMVGVMVQ